MISIILACLLQTPILDFTPADTYQGFPGMLYRGSNAAPPLHVAIGRFHALQLMAKPNKVVMLSLGMSNAAQEFRKFQELVQDNTRLVAVNGARGGMHAIAMSDSSCPKYDTYWTTHVPTRLSLHGLSSEDVDILWIKTTLAQPHTFGDFPVHAEIFRDALNIIIDECHTRFPNIRMILLCPRMYAGYATITLTPEPYAYESGFSVKWVIQSQIDQLDYVDRAWLGWGGYPWTNGERIWSTYPFVGLFWTMSDFRPDGTHPSDEGAEKFANFLLFWLQSDPVTSIMEIF